jgi:hypothetical protein
MSYRYGLLSTQRAVRWLTVLSVIIGQVAVMTKGADAYRETGFLFGPSPSAAEVYDHATGRALLIPGLPIDPPRPRDDAVRMAIIDSGVISTHPQLRTLVIAEKAFAGGDPVDRIGHGTLVALQSIRQHADPEMQRILGDRFSYPALLSGRRSANGESGHCCNPLGCGRRSTSRKLELRLPW